MAGFSPERGRHTLTRPGFLSECSRSLCDLFIFVWWQDRQVEDLELLVVLANILGLLVAGPPRESVCFCLCSQDRMPKHVRESLCVFACAHKTGCQSMFTHVPVCGLQPPVASKQRPTIRSLCRKACYIILTGSHTCGSKQLNMF